MDSLDASTLPETQLAPSQSPVLHTRRLYEPSQEYVDRFTSLQVHDVSNLEPLQYSPVHDNDCTCYQCFGDSDLSDSDHPEWKQFHSQPSTPDLRCLSEVLSSPVGDLPPRVVSGDAEDVIGKLDEIPLCGSCDGSCEGSCAPGGSRRDSDIVGDDCGREGQHVGELGCSRSASPSGCLCDPCVFVIEYKTTLDSEGVFDHLVARNDIMWDHQRSEKYDLWNVFMESILALHDRGIEPTYKSSDDALMFHLMFFTVGVAQKFHFNRMKSVVQLFPDVENARVSDALDTMRKWIQFFKQNSMCSQATLMCLFWKIAKHYFEDHYYERFWRVSMEKFLIDAGGFNFSGPNFTPLPF